MEKQTIRLRKKQLNQLFPDRYTKMRKEDFLTKAIENKDMLNKREFNALTNVKGNICNEHFEFYVKKRKDKIELIAFD
jgi:hypothetical protein